MCANLSIIEDGIARPRLMIEECAAIASACDHAASDDIHGNLPLYRALALAFTHMTMSLAYQTNVDKASEVRTREFLQELANEK